MPLQVAQFRGAETVPIGDQDHGRVTMAIAARLPRGDFSISAGVKYSRVRPTEEFTVVGDVCLMPLETMKIRIPGSRTGEVSPRQGTLRMGARALSGKFR